MIYNPQHLQARKRLQNHWLNVCDGIGFLCGIAVILPRLVQMQSQVFLALLCSMSLIVWLFRAREPKALQLQQNIFEQLEIPFSAAILTLCVSALIRSYYSGTALILFVLVWSSLIILSRLVLKYAARPIRVFVLENSSLAAELSMMKQIRLTTASTPPDTFADWDIALIDSSKVYSEAWLQWLIHADIGGVRIMSALSFNEAVTGRVPTEMLHGRWAPLVLHGRSPYAQLKRLLDVVVTLLLLPLLLPLSALVALAVFLDGGRPVLFWQERIGKGGLPFPMVKFRSMRRDSEAAGAAFASQGDLRVTRIGAFLRKYRLDELPQFYNVLRGEMSIIGPRPEQETFVRLFTDSIPLYAVRHHVRPGITGWAQVRQGYASGAEEAREKLRCDFYYIKNFSLALDARIVGETMLTILSGFGAR